MARMWATLGNPNPDPETFQHVGELVDGAYSDSPIPEQAAQRDERQIAILQSLARFDHSAEHPCPDSRHHTAPESRVATPVKPLKARTHKPHPALPGRLTTYGEAMPRIEIPDAAAIGDLPPALEQVERSGALINVFRVMLRSPQIASAVLSLGAAQFGTSSLASVDRELAILAAGSTFQAPYEAAQHAPISTAVGVSDAQRAAIAEGRWDSAEFSAPQQALLRFVADVAASPTVTDEVFAAVLAHYSQQQIVDVVVQTGYYFLIGRVTTVLDVPLDPPTDARVLDVGLSMTSKKK
jgi:4-carboxymuconolactone decarboxylase